MGSYVSNTSRRVLGILELFFCFGPAILCSTVQYCTVLHSTAGPRKKSEDPSGSIRDITAHLIHDKNTSIEVSCTPFNFPSAGNDPRWIHWSYEFLFFRPRGLRTRRPAQTGPGCQNPAFQRFDPMILCSFLWRFRKTKLESHNSKQMMVYEQTHLKKSIFSKNSFGSTIDFLMENRFLD